MKPLTAIHDPDLPPLPPDLEDKTAQRDDPPPLPKKLLTADLDLPPLPDSGNTVGDLIKALSKFPRGMPLRFFEFGEGEYYTATTPTIEKRGEEPGDIRYDIVNINLSGPDEELIIQEDEENDFEDED